MDYCMWHALGKLGSRETGEYKMFCGLRHCNLKQNQKEGIFLSYMSFSWSKEVAIEFIKIKNESESKIENGMLIEIGRNNRRCVSDKSFADVSWISKFLFSSTPTKLSKEFLDFARLKLFTSAVLFQCVRADNVFVPFASLWLHSPNNILTNGISSHHSCLSSKTDEIRFVRRREFHLFK